MTVRAKNINLKQLLVHIKNSQKILVATHENPDDAEVIKLAVAKRASLFEKHVGVETKKFGLNAYSATPPQIASWLQSATEAFIMCGMEGGKVKPSQKESSSLMSLRRGVFAKKPIKKGKQIEATDIFFSIPTSKGQLTANDLSKYTDWYSKVDLKTKDPILLNRTKKEDNQNKIFQAIQRVKKLIRESNVLIPNQVDLEISHHYGIDRFDQYGITLVNVINRDYCKKLIIILPGQEHPEQRHKVKEETFNVLYGTIDLELDGKKRQCKPGDLVVIKPGVKHFFSSATGAIIEEISSTHYKEDSFYTDPEIAKNKNRKTSITYWMD